MSCPQLTEKTLDVLQAIAALGRASLPQVREHCGLPMTTTHRILQPLLRRGFVMRTGRGDYRLGTSVVALADGLSHRDLLPAAARAHLQSLSRTTRSHCHLGIMEDGMVTYLVKQQYGKARLHSAEGTQLEAYCSALGKVLLSAFPPEEFERYVAEGDFVPLTANTITDADRLRREVDAIRIRGWASDDEEIAVGLRCVAVPVSDRTGRMLAAISVSTTSADRERTSAAAFVPLLLAAAQAIGRDLFPVP